MLGLAEVVYLVLVLLCLGFHQRMAATEEALFIIWGLIMAVVAAALLRLLGHTGHQAKAEAVALLLLQAAATDLLAPPRHKHSLA